MKEKSDWGKTLANIYLIKDFSQEHTKKSCNSKKNNLIKISAKSLKHTSPKKIPDTQKAQEEMRTPAQVALGTRGEWFQDPPHPPPGTKIPGCFSSPLVGPQ